MMRILLLILIPLSCIGQNRLVPFDFDTSNQTESYTHLESNGVSIYAECIELKRDLLVFDIEIKNESRAFLEIDPQEIYYYHSDVPFPDSGEENWEYYFRQQSTDSFRRYGESARSVENYYRKKIRSKENTKKLLAVLGTGLMIYDAVKDGQDFHREPTRNRYKNSIARDITLAASLAGIDVAGAVLTNEQMESDEDLHYLYEERFPFSDLGTGESVRGKIYFIQKPKFRYYRLLVPIENQFYVFDFRWPTYEEKKVIKSN